MPRNCTCLGSCQGAERLGPGWICALSPESRILAGVLPCEYVEGEWCLPSEADPGAVITYSSEPSPETGHIGWCWWALGKMGDAPSYEEAKRRAEEVIERLIGGSDD